MILKQQIKIYSSQHRYNILYEIYNDLKNNININTYHVRHIFIEGSIIYHMEAA